MTRKNLFIIGLILLLVGITSCWYRSETYLNSIFSLTVGVYACNSSAHVIDEYNLLGNNRTTVVADTLTEAGSKLFNTTRQVANRAIGESFQIQIKERPVVPVFLQNYLSSKSLINGPVYKSR